MEAVRVACDYGAFPVWADVKISDGLRRDLTSWAAVYDEILGLDEPFTERTWPNHLVSLPDWVVHGRSLAERLKREIGAGFTILYLNEQTHVWESI